MNKNYLILLSISFIAFISISFKTCLLNESNYNSGYHHRLYEFKRDQSELLDLIRNSDLNSQANIDIVKDKINSCRVYLKKMDFWLRYLEPISYKKINGPLPVEWETEVFEKFEKPYKREGAGLTLAALYLEDPNIEKDSLLSLIQQSYISSSVFSTDSIADGLKSYHHFFLCNRLFLLNLSTIYTTGFECPDTSLVVPELRTMLREVKRINQSFNESFPETPLGEKYLSLFDRMVEFSESQSSNYSEFDHFTFLKVYVNPLFAMNQGFIRNYKVVSKSYMDYSLNKNCNSIFSKSLYIGQNPKGVFMRVKEADALAKIDRVGKLLFYDPILSGNNKRSCASCHKPTEYFTDTILTTSLQFDRQTTLKRNSPSLINVEYNHLIMLDGKHISLQNQTKGVIENPHELGSNEKEVLQKLMSCKEYKNAFGGLLKYTPQEKEITFDHIVSAVTFYYSKFSKYYSPFDESMNADIVLPVSAKQGFNLFMSKAQCATCHFVPLFNGVKPPYTNSEFEVLGVPDVSSPMNLSMDKGRFEVHSANETNNAFRTGTVRNASHTGPYMHNGAFKNLREVIDFYDAGGGSGRGLDVPNQTLSSDSLHLSDAEKNKLIAFIFSLDEKIQFEKAPEVLPQSKVSGLNNRKVGGEY
ncbi:cytochrome-c peroxidase [Sporocytophaga myxococcoides]|uniref:cytochrome-c peroxidase n=1 Tax=Sporocytophaga myxococcoides TaxID=153721 RepID=UPI00041F6531|nr:cytochrome c peroxidase [Sporocytophaga myxococcoides]